MSRKQEICKLIRRKISGIETKLESGYTGALLASLRRGVGHAPGELPELLGIVLEGLPEEYLSLTGTPTREEWTVYITLTLYALHQQGSVLSQNTEDGTSIGKGLYYLGLKENDSNAAERSQYRLRMLASSKDIAELAYHLRGTIKLFRGENIKLDYGRLAGDLYDFQFDENRMRLFLRWGQDFFSGGNKMNAENAASENPETDVENIMEDGK